MYVQGIQSITFIFIHATKHHRETKKNTYIYL